MIEDKKFINLDTKVYEYFNNKKLLKLLEQLKIETIEDLLKYNLNFFTDNRAIGERATHEIKKLYKFMDKKKNQIYNMQGIKLRLIDYLEKEILVSKKSDNIELKSIIALNRLIEIYSKNNLSPKDRININLIFDYLLQNISINKNSKEENEYIFEIVSPSISKYESEKAAYKDLIAIIESLDEKTKLIIKERYGIFQSKKTLKEIGKTLNLTRERVRQIEKKGNKNIQQILKTKHYRIMNTFNKELYCPNENPLLEIICQYLLSSKKYVKNNFLDTNIYIKKGREQKIYFLLATIIENLETNGNYDLNELEDCKNLVKVFSKKYSVKNGIIYAKNSLKNCIPILMKRLNGPINLSNDKEVEEFVKKLKDIFNIKTDRISERGLGRIISECSILYGPNTYINEEKIDKLSSPDIIFSYIEKERITTSTKIYDTFKKEWNEIKIYNQYGVYGYLKHFYPDKYTYAGRSMLISIKGEKSAWGAVVIEKVKQQHRPISFEEMSKEYDAINNSIWMNLPNIFDDLISWGDNYIYCISELKIDNKDINTITLYIFNNNKIVSTKELFSFLLLNNHEFLEKNHISNERQLKRVISSCMNEIIHVDPEGINFYI